jgi:hypothetical protein
MRLLLVFLISGCTLNFAVDIESASGRDGTISESAAEETTTTPTVDVTADANGV